MCAINNIFLVNDDEGTLTMFGKLYVSKELLDLV